MRITDDKDIAAVQASISQVVKDAIGQIAAVVIPALLDACKNVAGSVSITVTVPPIKISIEIPE